MSDLLETYLQDHHAASVAAQDAFDRVASGHSNAHVREEVNRLGSEFREDHLTLESMLTALEASSSTVKDAAARLGERAGRLKLNNRVLTRSPLSDLVELEGLVLAVHARVLLLSAFRAVDDPRIDVAAVDRLIERADAQEAALERLRLAQTGVLTKR